MPRSYKLGNTREELAIAKTVGRLKIYRTLRLEDLKPASTKDIAEGVIISLYLQESTVQMESSIDSRYRLSVSSPSVQACLIT